jgi:hypothetical protein
MRAFLVASWHGVLAKLSPLRRRLERRGPGLHAAINALNLDRILIGNFTRFVALVLSPGAVQGVASVTVKYCTLRSTPVRKPIDRDTSQKGGFIGILKAQVSVSQNYIAFGQGLSDFSFRVCL